MCFGKQGGGTKEAFQQAMTVPIFDALMESMDIVNAGKDEDLDLMSLWFAHQYVQPCVKSTDVNEWFDIKPAGKGVRGIKK